MLNLKTQLLLTNLPPEVLLHIFSFLDIPDLSQLSAISPLFSRLAADKALHRSRLLVVAPSRLEHFLLAHLRPTIADLCQWNLMRGLGIERRWRAGSYFYSPQSVQQYENSLRLQRTHVRYVLTSHFQSRPATPVQSIHVSRIFPDTESSSPRMSRSLIPVVRKLKWSFKRDRLANIVRCSKSTTIPDESEETAWLKRPFKPE